MNFNSNKKSIQLSPKVTHHYSNTFLFINSDLHIHLVLPQPENLVLLAVNTLKKDRSHNTALCSVFAKESLAMRGSQVHVSLQCLKSVTVALEVRAHRVGY